MGQWKPLAKASEFGKDEDANPLPANAAPAPTKGRFAAFVLSKGFLYLRQIITDAACGDADERNFTGVTPVLDCARRNPQVTRQIPGL